MEVKKKYIIEVEQHKFQCQQCQHIWVPRDFQDPPMRCPKCLTLHWGYSNDSISALSEKLLKQLEASQDGRYAGLCQELRKIGGPLDETKPYLLKFTIVKFKCQRCKYEWEPRNPDKEPLRCAKCQTFDWKGFADE